MGSRTATVIAVPTIAVVIPLYNKAAFVHQAIEAVLAQTSPVNEVIVIDDGSTDAGPAIVASFADIRIRLESQANAGVSAARNRGIRAAQSEFVAFLDADDFYSPDFVGAIRALIAKWPEASLFCSGYSRALPDGRHVSCTLPTMRPNDSGLITDFYMNWCQQRFTNSSAMVVRRNALLACQPMFAEGERLGEDQDLWFRLAEQHEVAYVNSALSIYRIDVPASATNQNTTDDFQLLGCYERLGQRLIDGQVPKQMRAGARKLLSSHLLNLVRRCLDADRMELAMRFLLDRRSFGHPLYWVRTAVLVLRTRLSFGLSK